jgi:hypothetical protein
MSKKLRNLALLGGLGAAAALAMRGKGKDEESKDTTGDASAGMAKDRLSDYRGKSGDVNKDIGAAVKRATAPAAKPTAPAAAPRSAKQEALDDAKIFGSKAPMEGRTASGMPREARGVADTRTPMQRFASRQETAADRVNRARREQMGLKSGGMVGSASKRADGCATKGKTRGKMI